MTSCRSPNYYNLFPIWMWAIYHMEESIEHASTDPNSFGCQSFQSGRHLWQQLSPSSIRRHYFANQERNFRKFILLSKCNLSWLINKMMFGNWLALRWALPWILMISERWYFLFFLPEYGEYKPLKLPSWVFWASRVWKTETTTTLE